MTMMRKFILTITLITRTFYLNLHKFFTFLLSVVMSPDFTYKHDIFRHLLLARPVNIISYMYPDLKDS